MGLVNLNVRYWARHYHQKDETSTSSAAGDNETEQGDNVSVEVDANINELRQPSADQPEISVASASSPTLHAVDIPAYTSTDPGTWGEINDEVRAYWADRGPQLYYGVPSCLISFGGPDSPFQKCVRKCFLEPQMLTSLGYLLE
ncbi:unnamed protein product [Leuciscus chuanchicus]